MNFILAMVGVVFLTLKLLGMSEVATWSWWLVLLPFYVTYLIGACVMAITFIIAIAVAILAFIIALFNGFNR